MEGTGNEIKVRLADTTRYGLDNFYIVSDEWLNKFQNMQEFAGQYETDNLRPINS